ncbi:MAG: hypothetical protein LRY54_01755 [Alphaproteobacteria bacterium]|nr:hypothetical protein [Alphaproteobacteria bacterium]
MTDLLQEVDDMMRQEKLAKLWREHGNFIIGVILAIILATALVSAYKSWTVMCASPRQQRLWKLWKNRILPRTPLRRLKTSAPA